ncbi:2-haloacid dehalogenase [Oikeobacillus pervagus]|uniref:2-haloacid dehalogenase n=1 Tax=Oikeobacillus pervagus TaxID=1325931 RepID=A0AAJ1WII8_9BACI|nr:YjjG family noncanonical pyrimidine nucleotidase [Oikeobacillus pervagus]MDQ0214473.1 2-haloacid dehalogenase [Oikeobacillus pervagus]
MKYEIVLFDVDDTLFDFTISEKKALHKAFCEFDLPTGLSDYHGSYNEISQVLWRDLEQGNMTILELGVERFRRLFCQYGMEIDAEKFNHVYLGYLGKEAPLIEGAEKLCQQLNPLRLAVITNGFKEIQISRIESSPLRNTFEYIFTSEEAGFQKPEKEIFDYVFSKMQITDKNKVLIVGDSLTSDIQGGIHYGIDTCWFNRYSKENHTSNQPTYEISELGDLVKMIGS